AKVEGIPVVHLQHIANPAAGPAPFFNRGTPGAGIHQRVLAAAPEAPVVVKEFADGFVGTRLEEELAGLGARDLLVCGMLSRNCVTHTAISKSAEKYKVSILPIAAPRSARSSIRLPCARYRPVCRWCLGLTPFASNQTLHLTRRACRLSVT